MLAHGFTLEIVTAMALGFAGVAAGVSSIRRGSGGRRGAVALALTALLCAILVLAVSVSEYYNTLTPLADAGLLGYELSFTEALREAASYLGGFCFLPAILGGLGLLFALGKARRGGSED